MGGAGRALHCLLQTVPEGGLRLYADSLSILDSQFGLLERESIYSDSINFAFQRNRVETVNMYAFSCSNNVFNFTDNTVGSMQANAMSVAFLHGDISGYLK